jgi:ABC-type nitrate/sulfonate/bicarbonate transport system permease component
MKKVVGFWEDAPTALPRYETAFSLPILVPLLVGAGYHLVRNFFLAPVALWTSIGPKSFTGQCFTVAFIAWAETLLALLIAIIGSLLVGLLIYVITGRRIDE